MEPSWVPGPFLGAEDVAVDGQDRAFLLLNCVEHMDYIFGSDSVFGP